jgi:hypothetical protein
LRCVAWTPYASHSDEIGTMLKCPHCTIAFHENWDPGSFLWDRKGTGWAFRVALCPSCKEHTIQIIYAAPGSQPQNWITVVPAGVNRGPVPAEIPADIAQDYKEACAVLPTSAKASAALSRRCLQHILRSHGYKARDLATEIDLLLRETDPLKALPLAIRETIDAIRNFGNFSAHPLTDTTSLQVIDVEPEEAEWCLEIIEALFEHFYVAPARAKQKKAALNAKLTAAGKPQAK